MAQKLEQHLEEVGSKLQSPPNSKDALAKLLKQAATYLSELDQSPPPSALESMNPFLNAIVKPELLKHQDKDVKLLVATCICEITRITAPEAPFSDDVLKDTFHLIVGTFSGLSDTSGPSFSRRVVILETLAKYRSCVVMLDLECDDLVNDMFTTFLAVARDDHPENVLSSMQTIMIVLLEESEDVREDLLYIVLSVLGRHRKHVTEAARRMAMNVIDQCAAKLEAGIKQFLISSMSGDSKLVSYQIDYHEVIYDVYRCAPQILSVVVPYLTEELVTDQLEIRLKAVGLVGDLFALPGSVIPEAFQPIFSEFLKRLSDRVVAVRMSALEHIRSCLLSNPLRAEAFQIFSALFERLLDFDENIRKQVVAVICDVASHTLGSFLPETVKHLAERLRDKSVLVKKYTMERLAEIHKIYCLELSKGSVNAGEFDWIPGKILRCFYDKDFRSDTIEYVLCTSLFPNDFTVKNKVQHWVRVFSKFEKVEVKALEKILEQKQRLYQEMQRYLSLRQMHQDSVAPEIQKKILFCFRIMSRSFADPAKAEENFQILDQLKDANIWKILTNLVDPNISSLEAYTLRDDLLRILGQKHRLYDFLSILSVKSSYLLFNKEHVKEILLEAATQKSTGNSEYTMSCMTILVILACFSPFLLNGAEEELINFLKDDDEIIKEGVLHVLAKAGGTIREQLTVSASSVDLILERLCLEGSRRQAKYAVHALAAITKDDGLKSLSILYKRLVDMLEEKTHLPAILQSLGCIAQTAMPIFETRENEIIEFIINKILKCDNKVEDRTKTSWDQRSELCLLKIFGIKTLVKSYLPAKDAQVRPGIDGVMDILRNILSFGEISKDIESSLVDKAHLRLASAKAVLRLSRHWDDKIPIDVFHLTLRTSEICFPEARRLFLTKLHQYLKDRLLDGKYACAFVFNIFKLKSSEFREVKQSLTDIIQMYHQMKARQLSMQSDPNSLTTYPEYILPYFVHALAHHSCPDIEECKDAKAYEQLYRQLHLILALLVHGDEDLKSESSASTVKDSIVAINSIFQSIKHSADVFDVAMSKKSHAICDLGKSITKRLATREEDLQGFVVSVPLPPMIYKPCQKEEENDSVVSESLVWLADESILAHFESLKMELDETALPETSRDEVLQEMEIDGNEVPLGKIMKHLKSKAKKVKSSKSSPAKVDNGEKDVDILKMVREINLDNLGKSSNFELTNGHEKFPCKKERLDSKLEKGEKRKASDDTPIPVPKKRRSLAHGISRIPSSSLKVSSKDTWDDLRQKKFVGSSGTGLLTSCSLKNASKSMKHKVKGLNQDEDDVPNALGEVSDHEKSDLMETDKIDSNSCSQSTVGPNKKRKNRKNAGLAKSKFKEIGKDVEDLIGCRIKVWWPMDKKFYEGTVKSYDPLKQKHVVLYDDGDVEVLRLGKEHWEVVEKDQKSIKVEEFRSITPVELKLNSSKNLSIKGSPGRKNKNSDGPRQNKKGVKIDKDRQPPKKVLKHVQKFASRDNHYESGDKGTSDVSNPEPKTSKMDKMNRDSSEDELAGKGVENIIDGQDSDNEVKSVSKRKQLEGGMERRTDVYNFDDEEPGDSPANRMKATAKHAQSGDEEKLGPESSAASKEHSNEQDQSDSEGHNLRKDVENSHMRLKKLNKRTSDPSDVGDAQISDDEPLSKWKHRVVKKGSRHGQ